MSQPQIHFIHDPNKKHDAFFAGQLIKELGQTEPDKAKDIVVISGDGMLLHTFRLYPGKRICGVVSPGSESRGFWANKDINNASDLLEILENAESYAIRPLKADIGFADGSHITRLGYNDITMRGVHKDLPDELRERFGLSAIDVSVQSASISLKVEFKSAVQCERMICSGLIFSTPFGSTAMNKNFGGPVVDIRHDAILLTAIGSANGFSPRSNSIEAVFTAEVQEPDKRPVIVTFDSFGVERNEHDRPIQNLKVSIADEGTVYLLSKDDPGLRAYS